MSDLVRVRIDGVERELDASANLAAALVGAGVWATRRALRGEARGPVCGMGVCFECRATVDGRDHERTCMRTAGSCRTVETMSAPSAFRAPNESGDSSPRSEELAHRELACDVLVVGAGPAGLAAAVGAASRGKRTVLVDDNPSSGGQIWRAEGGGAAENWRERAREAGVIEVRSASVVLQLEERMLRLRTPDELVDVRCEALVLCTGATELFLPFPGWTLPNVLGVGGLQALVKGGLDVRGKRVVLAGSGPLLLAVAAGLTKRGARVLLVAEQAPRARVLGFAAGLVAQPGKLLQALTLRLATLGVEQRFGTWPIEAHGDDRLRELVLGDGTRTTRIECDYAGVGFGLVPNARLAALLGCELDGRRVRVDAELRTSVDWIFAAGECTGVGGVEKALLEGRSAGAAAAGDASEARRLAGRLTRERRFAERLAVAFAPRAELLTLAQPDTVVCRCEDVRHAELCGTSAHTSWRASKLHTRAGMGACQGRICGPALEVLAGFRAADVRPPLVPVPLGALVLGDHALGSNAPNVRVLGGRALADPETNAR